MCNIFRLVRNQTECRSKRRRHCLIPAISRFSNFWHTDALSRHHRHSKFRTHDIRPCSPPALPRTRGVGAVGRRCRAVVKLPFRVTNIFACPLMRDRANNSQSLRLYRVTRPPPKNYKYNKYRQFVSFTYLQTFIPIPK